jgi:ABC-type molybdenum transport system ATPase subunit/photorepair protein PhrA
MAASAPGTPPTERTSASADLKLIFLGSSGAGKTSLLRRYTENTWSELGEKTVRFFAYSHRERCWEPKDVSRIPNNERRVEQPAPSCSSMKELLTMNHLSTDHWGLFCT